MKQSVEINTKYYFEGISYTLGWFFAVMTIILLITNWKVAPIFGFLAFLILTAQYKLIINHETKEVDDFLHIMGLRSKSQKHKFSSLEYIYITQSRFTQRMNYEWISSSLSGELYTAYLRTDVSKIYIGESTDLKKLMGKVRPIAEKLNLEIKN